MRVYEHSYFYAFTAFYAQTRKSRKSPGSPRLSGVSLYAFTAFYAPLYKKRERSRFAVAPPWDDEGMVASGQSQALAIGSRSAATVRSSFQAQSKSQILYAEELDHDVSRL